MEIPGFLLINIGNNNLNQMKNASCLQSFRISINVYKLIIISSYSIKFYTNIRVRWTNPHHLSVVQMMDDKSKINFNLEIWST
jgi:hypothetical protein